MWLEPKDSHGLLSTRLWVAPPDPTNPPTTDHERYPTIIMDQRHAFRCHTVVEVEDFWFDHLDRTGMTLTSDERTAVPFINRARWLALCPACGIGNFAWDRNPSIMCLDCGLLYKPAWSSPFVRAAAIRLLSVREMQNCNWHPHEGETLADLERDNWWYLGIAATMKDNLWLPSTVRPPENLADYFDPLRF